jgi:hypothetical protein
MTLLMYTDEQQSNSTEQKERHPAIVLMHAIHGSKIK